MANLKRSVVLLAALAVFAGCASKLGYEVAPREALRPPSEPSGPSAALHGRLSLSDGTRVDLAQASELPTVLVFSQDTCAVCGQEADSLRKSLVSGHAPSRVRLLTVLVGAVIQDALDWIGDHQVSWPVAIDTDSSVFASYCAERTVPCNVVFLPGQGIVANKNGPMTPEELQALTGAWESR